ncbi:MAG: RNA repair transcriptional activator RtcR [Planctomycetaceae bacterium]|jgi:transcriptional regulatory protein RtcR|nr:RNA repair transcriptional activator RtcR [Planctomycetaceae bacterium]
MKTTVIFGFLGSKRDAGDTEERWDIWRPTVALGMYSDLRVKRLELFYSPEIVELLNRVTADLHQISPELIVSPHAMPFDDPWDFEEVYAKLFDFMKQYRFDLETEEYLFHIKTGTHAWQICYFLLTEARFFPGKLLQSFAPRPNKPEEKGIGTYHIIDLDTSKYKQIVTRFEQERRDSVTFLKSGIVTRNKAFNELIGQIEMVALRTREPILLTGGTGTGKSQLAKRIYELKKFQERVSGQFVAVNAATLRGEQAMSTLFGYIKGSFTGAGADRAGLLLTANRGVLFLDEIGELGLDEQAMLLRAIEEKHFLPVGSDAEVESDFQLIAATNKDLNDNIVTGTFREDLLARINLWTFCLPDLKDRCEDIEPNIDYELVQYALRNNQKIMFNKDARERFTGFAVSLEAEWRANFRDLNAAVVRMATLSTGGRITIETVENEIEHLRTNWNRQVKKDEDVLLLQTILGKERLAELDLFDAVQLAKVLRICRESKSLAESGRKLFQYSRTKKKSANDTDRVSKYLAAFGLDWENVKDQ